MNLVLKDERDKLMRLQAELEALPQVDCPLEHYFAPGQYARRITMPKGSVVVGKIHKHAHINVLVKGRCEVRTPTGSALLKAGDVFVSEAGTKRAVHMLTEVVWVTIHTREDDSTDLGVLEQRIIAPSFAAYIEHEHKEKSVDYSPRHMIPATYTDRAQVKNLCAVG